MSHPDTKTCSIYAIRCDVNVKVFIGYSHDPERRAADCIISLNSTRCYAPGRPEFSEDFRKYGLEHFDLHILESDIPDGHVRSREAHWINEYKADDPEHGYNKPKQKPRMEFKRAEGLPPKPRQRDGA